MWAYVVMLISGLAIFVAIGTGQLTELHWAFWPITVLAWALALLSVFKKD